MTSEQMLIQGRWVVSRAGALRTLTDPGNGEVLAQVPEATREDMALAIDAARQAFDHGPWRGVSAMERAQLLFRVADAIRSDARRLSILEVLSTGKPLAEAEIDVADAASCFAYYGGLATRLDSEIQALPPVPSQVSLILREPVGVCGQIIPWNYPFLMAAWKLAPALAAGCTLILKPSELTPLTALALGRILEQVGLPPGVVNIVTGPGAGPGEALVESPLVDKIAFTGGSEVGRRIMLAATRPLKRLTLELGGKNPNILFADAPLSAALDGAIGAAFANQGEVCSAGSRLLVEASIHDAVVEGLLERMARLRLGHGLTPGVQMGPLISRAHREKVEHYIHLGQQEGARLCAGGRRPAGAEFERGWFLEPTLFDRVHPTMRIAREEIFGPVLCVLPFRTEAEAIQLANDTEYGLAAAVWSQDIPRALRVVRAIRVGIAWVNGYHTTSHALPWGGVKQSGIGRELGLQGLDAYLEARQLNLHFLDPAATAAP